MPHSSSPIRFVSALTALAVASWSGPSSAQQHHPAAAHPAAHAAEGMAHMKVGGVSPHMQQQMHQQMQQQMHVMQQQMQHELRMNEQRMTQFHGYLKTSGQRGQGRGNLPNPPRR